MLISGRIVTIVLTILILGAQVFANDKCLKQMEKLHDLRTQYVDEMDVREEMRDALFTIAVVESPLFTAKPFFTFAEEAYDYTKKTEPAKNFGRDQMTNLKAKYDENRMWMKHFIGINDAKSQSYRAKMDTLTQEMAALKQEQKEKKAIRRNLYWNGNPAADFAKLPSVVKIKSAEGIWKKLLDFYKLPKAPEELTLDDTKQITAEMASYDILFKDAVMTSQVIQKIDQDPILREAMLELIADVAGAVQYEEKILQNAGNLKKKLLAQGTTRKELYGASHLAINDVNDGYFLSYKKVDKKGEDTEHSFSYNSDIVNLVTQDYPVLFNDRYFGIFSDVLKGQSFDFKEFVESYPSYSQPMRRDLSLKIWEALMAHYQVDRLDWISGRKGAEIIQLAQLDGVTTDEFISRGHVIKAVNEKPEVLEKVLLVMETGFAKTAELIPHLEKAAKWRARLGKGVLFAAPSALLGTVGGLVETASVLNHFHLSDGVGSAILLAGTVGGAALLPTLYSGFFKLQERFAKKKAQGIKDGIRTDISALRDNHEEPSTEFEVPEKK